MCAWGWPPRISVLKEMAKHLLSVKSDTQAVGQHWYKNFLIRHPNLKAKYSRSLDQNRKHGQDPKAIRIGLSSISIPGSSMELPMQLSTIWMRRAFV